MIARGTEQHNGIFAVSLLEDARHIRHESESQRTGTLSVHSPQAPHREKPESLRSLRTPELIDGTPESDVRRRYNLPADDYEEWEG